MRNSSRFSPSFPDAGDSMIVVFTRRQKEIGALLERDLSSKEIAALLNLAEQTVKNHICRLSQKLGAHGRSETIERFATEKLTRFLEHAPHCFPSARGFICERCNIRFDLNAPPAFCPGCGRKRDPSKSGEKEEK
jgi:DNA-binding CsgD family transcriptional regulator